MNDSAPKYTARPAGRAHWFIFLNDEYHALIFGTQEKERLLETLNRSAAAVAAPKPRRAPRKAREAAPAIVEPDAAPETVEAPEAFALSGDAPETAAPLPEAPEEMPEPSRIPTRPEGAEETIQELTFQEESRRDASMKFGPKVARWRRAARGRSLTREERREYGEAVCAGVRALQHREFMSCLKAPPSMAYSIEKVMAAHRAAARAAGPPQYLYNKNGAQDFDPTAANAEYDRQMIQRYGAEKWEAIKAEREAETNQPAAIAA